jgi:hypothetical protein
MSDHDRLLGWAGEPAGGQFGVVCGEHAWQAGGQVDQVDMVSAPGQHFR